MSAKEPTTHYLKDYQPADFIIETVHMHFDIYEDETIVKSILKLKRNPAAVTPKAPLVLDGEAMELKEIKLNGHTLENAKFKVDAQSLTISNVPDTFLLETEVVIHPEANTTLMGLYKSRNNFCTQCESHGFRRITYYLDRPDVMSHFTTTITADKSKYPILLSNGNLIEEKDLSDNRHWVHWEDPFKKPSYLFALVAGDFDLLKDSFTTCSGRDVQLRLYLERGYADQGHYALECLKRAMNWDEQTFGREYDLSVYMIVAVSDFNMGAMENKGLNIFNTKYILANNETATDLDYAAIEAVIGHEYFHNWSGNRVTCRDWFQLTLKEGLTVFRDQSFSQDMTSPAIARVNEVNVVRNNQFVEDAGPMAHPIRPDSYIEINNFYTSTVYRKGAEVIRMVQTLLGRKLFRKGMDLYFTRHDGQAVTTEDFIQAMADVSDRDFTQFCHWYHQAGTPKLEVSDHYDAAVSTYQLTVKQSCSPTPGQKNKEPFHLPLAMGLVGSECQDLPVQLEGEKQATIGTRVLEINQPTQHFTFINVTEKPVPSLLRNFSAPVELKFPYDNEQLAWLACCDSDMFARWDATQWLAINVIDELVRQQDSGDAMQCDSGIIDVFSKQLEDTKSDCNLIARLLSLPPENYLLTHIHHGRIETVHAAREFVKAQLASQLESQFKHVYDRFNTGKPYEYNTQLMGERSIKNICLFYLVESKKAEHAKLAYQQFANSDNMTDVMGALIALNNHDIAERGIALNEFYDKWQHEALVVNKWLGLQACSHLPQTLEHVKQLLTHEAFNIHNPNNVYALLVGFGNNTVRFHDSSGRAYAFLAEQVLKIDPENPQVSARVLQPLTSWQRYDEVRGMLMKQQLERIAKTPGLSKDVFEVANKCIAD